MIAAVEALVLMDAQGLAKSFVTFLKSGCARWRYNSMIGQPSLSWPISIGVNQSLIESWCSIGRRKIRGNGTQTYVKIQTLCSWHEKLARLSCDLPQILGWDVQRLKFNPHGKLQSFRKQDGLRFRHRTPYRIAEKGESGCWEWISSFGQNKWDIS